jgi:thiol-disulfide isomerase/thioredoxin
MKPNPPAQADHVRRRALSSIAGALMASFPAAAWPAATPSVAATLLDGRAFSTDQVAGKVLFINFWATWCGPCRAEMPEIDAYYRAHRERGLEVLALSTDELADEPKVREVAKAFSFPVAMLKTSKLTGFGRIWRMPVSAVINRQGQLVKQDWFIEPKLDAAALEAVIRPLL